MKAWSRKRSDRPAKKRIPERKRSTRTAPPPPPAPPPSPPANPNIHYEAGWTDSWSHRRCLHRHRTLLEAAECAMPTGAGWYVFAVEDGRARELREAEEKIVNHYRFGR
jgi:hypothetical protein